MSSVRSASDRSLPGPGSAPRVSKREPAGTSLSATERYVICDYLAEGGMGAIYLGKRMGVGGFEKQVVLKQLLPEFGSDPQITELFLQEARLSASLDHQNIVHTIDLVEVSGSYYMIMEYVRGGDLRTLLRRVRRRGNRFSPAAALLIGRGLLDALDYAHGKKRPDGQPLHLIHRDISPSNVLLSEAGEVKLTDFGIARAALHGTGHEPGAYHVRGKIGYMSPEQARGEELDERSDLFSLAVLLYEVVCGERLFVGNASQSPAQVYGTPIAPPSRHVPGLPSEFDRVLLKALSLQREGRYGSAQEFHAALLGMARRHNLLITDAEMAGHLRQLCGPDPDAWLRDEERTGTAMIAPGDPGDDDLDEDEAPVPPPSAQREPPGESEMTEPTSLPSPTEVMDFGAPIEAMDMTQPMEKQPEGSIAAMARKMVTREMRRDAPSAEGPPSNSRPPAAPPERDDDTAAVTTQRPATVPMPIPPEPELAAAPALRGWPISPGSMMLLSLLVLFLLGLGLVLGMLLSGPHLDGEARPPPAAPGPQGASPAQ